MESKFIIILPFIAMFVSGCTQVESGNGLVIQNIEPDLPQAFSGEEVTFFARIKNTGSVTATNAHAELLGIDQDWYNEGVQIGKGPWVNGKKLPEEEKCSYTGGFSLKPPDPFYGTEGASFTCSWKYLAPELPPTTTITYNPTVRVYYAYQSQTVKSVTIVPKDQLRLLQDSGQPLPSDVKSQSRSPVSIDVETPGPVRTSFNNVEFPLRIRINNINSGTVCYPNTAEACKKQNINWNKIKLTIDLPDTMRLLDCDQEIVLDLFRGQSNSITCKVLATNIVADFPTTSTIIAIGDYMYLIDKSTSVSVSGSQQLP